MPARLLDGKSIAKQIRAELAEGVESLVSKGGFTPKLAAVLVGDDAASEVYVRNKRKDCERVGIESVLHRLPESTSQAELLGLLDGLNSDASVHGILVQLPVPKQIDPEAVASAIDPAKDVDCLHPENVGLLAKGRPRFKPCTPHGVQQILLREGIETAGRRAVVVGRSEIVGKPLAAMLALRGEGGDATVTLCHSRTDDLAGVAREADILLVAIGKPEFVTAEMVKPGAVVIDIGVNRTEAGLVGDVEFEAVSRVASAITPVPGGVGPLTRTMLLVNTLAAASEIGR
ncbi:MAG: bifunctional methylenetetrahydrofolate dehydrogenase/methenyltetrahydrofolate cyclohydrolase FolD [Planctomycetota bacterium]